MARILDREEILTGVFQETAVYKFNISLNLLQNACATEPLVCKMAESKMQPSEPRPNGITTTPPILPDLGVYAVVD